MATRRASTALLWAFAVGLAQADAPPPKYVGAAACASQNCHGSATARRDSETSLQNEYVTWSREDRHAKAYAILDGPLGKRIASQLGIANPQKEKRCLDCHATNVPTKARGERFRLEDGVSCESCHGPAGAWLARHTERDWAAERSLPLGMRDTPRPEVAAETCLGCHLGSPTKRVDHELLAAGHPALAFELDTFAANMPAHWAEHAANRGWFRGEAWTAGQVVAAREAALQFARQMRERGWPDFAAYDCQACHHEVSNGSWTLRGKGGRPPIDGARGPGVDALVRVVAPDQRDAVRQGADRLGAAAITGAAGPETDRAVTMVSKEMTRLLGTVRTRPPAEAQLVALMRALVDLADPTARLGFRAAQQAAWALDSLADARAAQRKSRGEPADDAALRAAIGRVYEGLREPSHYDAARTGRALAAVRTSLP
jgi:hypothetical protein